MGERFDEWLSKVLGKRFGEMLGEMLGLGER